MSEWANKWFRKGEISKEWRNYIINEYDQPGKNSTLCKTHKQGDQVRLLTAGCNTAIENLSRFIANICESLSENICYRIKDTSHLFDIIDTVNEKEIPDEIILVPLYIVNTFLNIDNVKGMNTVRLVLNTKDSKKTHQLNMY